MKEFQAAVMANPDHANPEFPMEHDFIAGMYARTLTMPPWTWLMGAHMKCPTMVITVGTGCALVGREWEMFGGYRRLEGSAGRKQIFASLDGPLIITMLFPTTATTVEDAEREFTDEHELLLSHRQDVNTITGETK
jgi:hypothetical protein